MKKTKAFSLEEDIIKTIEDYQKKYNLSSASSALERIILVELPKRTDLQEIKSMINDLNANGLAINEELSLSKDKEELVFKNNNLKDSFKSSLDDMPD